MRKKQMRIVSSALVMSMAVMCLTGCSKGDEPGAQVGAKSKAEDQSAEDVKTEELADKVVNGLKGGSVETGKDETVYVVMDNNGNAVSVLVNDVLKNIGSGDVRDVSELEDIYNLKGDETFSVSENDMIWASEGKDITYQGTTDKELPVSVNITYKLDGEEVLPETLAGASGHLEITYEYVNKTETQKEVNGQNKKVVVPFIAASGMMLPSKNCSNVRIDNGKAIEEGDNVIVVGYAVPGLMDCIESQIADADELLEHISLGDSFTVEADVTDFEMDMSLTVILPDVIGSKELKDVDTDEITDKIDELSDAADKLSDGTGRLDDGAGELVSGAGELDDGSKKIKEAVNELKGGTGDLKKGVKDLKKGSGDLKKGAGTLKDGTKSLEKGAKDLDDAAVKLQDGAKNLNDGAKSIVTNLGTLSAGAASLETGAKQVVDGIGTLKTNVQTFKTQAGAAVTGIGTVATGVATVDGYMKQIVAGFEDKDGEAGLVNGSKQVADGVAALVEILKNSTATIDAQIDEIMKQVKTVSGIDSSAALTKTVAGIDKQISANQSTVPIADILTNATDGKINTYEQYMALVQANYSIIALCEVRDSLNTMISARQAELAKLTAGSAGVASGINTVYTSLGTLSENVTALNTGAATLNTQSQAINSGFTDLITGIDTLLGGANQVYTGAQSLNTGAAALKTGASTLSSGATTLYDGLKTLKGGTHTLYTGSAALKVGASKLYDGSTALGGGVNKLYSGSSKLDKGAGALYKGVVDLNAGTGKLYDGAVDLKEGTSELDDGMLQFNDEAITPITDKLGDRLPEIYDLVYAIAQEGDEYNNFAGINTQMDGTVKFIYKTNGIKKSEEE
ncbi:MAG: hypothetical protein HFH14_02900 [Lachnospiraceae bacterium]|nr:hypothetical protein [Lachnospiraceae bacterium]